MIVWRKAAVFGATAMLLVAPGAAQAQEGPATLERCERLAALATRYQGRSGEGNWVPPDTTIGLEQCRKGRVEDGVRILERRLRTLGFTPPQ